ncbi:ATP-grasp fold amidoligase family protein [Bacillus sp. FJAT-45066]|uniref:ATP-grasp fold amidoligase family protein n=1 Tax=Bacillus sp. FJAT-45066 TaxID=2011010 RepID=UPI000BB69C0C|nr:ATP-grasp fold amidoligase family protein [Bacillus sp. FJAT-45066]
MSLKKIIKVIKRPQNIFMILGNRGFFRQIGDKTYLKIAYWCKMGKKLDIDSPKTYNEKIQWLKLNDRNPNYSKYVDKYEVRKYIAEKIGEVYLIPLIGVWDSIDDVNFEKLPKEFVLKSTHDSGGVVVCKDKQCLDIKKAKEKIRTSLNRNYFWGQREWIYKDIKPRVIAEKYMVDKIDKELRDYKFFCFNGEVKAMFVASDRGIDTRFDFFDMDFNHMPFMQHYPNAEKPIKKPKNFNEMKSLAQKLSKGFPHVRVDFYDVNGKVYFGELTFYHFSGWEKFEPECYDKYFGDWLDITELNEKNHNK